VVPTFFFVAVGGLNGPLHGVLTAVFARQSDEAECASREGERGAFAPPEGLAASEQKTSSDDRAGTRRGAASASASASAADAVVTVATLACAFAAALTFALADAFVALAAPGLDAATRLRAAAQLRVMAPCVLLAAVNGAQMARMTAAGEWVAPAAAPAVSSAAVVAAVAWFTAAAPNAVDANLVLPLGVLLGALAQTAALRLCASREANRVGGRFRLASARGARASASARASTRALVRASAGSALMQTAASTDLFFASFTPTAAAGLGYATLLAATPLGILSAALLTPLVPRFARVAAAAAAAAAAADADARDARRRRRAELRRLVGDALFVVLALTTLAVAVGTPLAGTLVALLFQRDAFDEGAAALVAEVARLSLLGGFFAVARDVLQRAHYVGLGDGATPLRVAALCVFVNAAMNAALTIWPGRLGVRGIAISTACAGAVAVVALWRALGDEERDDDGGLERARDGTPADQAPADQAPADQAPADQAPADQAPADRRREERLRGAAKVAKVLVAGAASFAATSATRDAFAGGARVFDFAGAAATSVFVARFAEAAAGALVGSAAFAAAFAVAFGGPRAALESLEGGLGRWDGAGGEGGRGRGEGGGEG
jgi:peptidoglycan biosynthesis protein MviN/MurJ (putative lipid II flippase)